MAIPVIEHMTYDIGHIKYEVSRLTQLRPCALKELVWAGLAIDKRSGVNVSGGIVCLALVI